MKRYIKASSVEYDSEGNELTPEQSAFFRNSKVRDNQGRLLVCYHGTDNSGFSEFRPSTLGYGFFFTASKSGAETFGTNLIFCYLNIKNPLIYDAEGKSALYLNYVPDEFADADRKTRIENTWHHIDDLAYYAESSGHDGLIVYNVKDTNTDSNDVNIDDYVVFKPNQIKSISNKNPTSSNNINAGSQL